MSETFDNYDNWEDEGQDSPVALVGILVMLLTTAAIMVNALFMQPKSAEIDMINRASQEQQVSQEATGTIAKKNASGYALKNDHAAMVLAIQRQLTMAGYYMGPLDGMEGAQTREAILAFQDAIGMPANGRASLQLHNILIGRKQYTPSVQAVAAPKPEPTQSDLDALPRSKPMQQADSGADVVVPTVRLASVRVNTGPTPPAEIPASPEADPMLAKVQSALQKFGYADLTVDGLMGSRTQSAIAGFQRSRGLAVTGKVNDRLLQDMMILGYLELG
ncbi:Putative peptidoglycan binding domain-containing protein [Cohaesibacter sp. ES.047]|uniref:peptidoglycan-binding protein n=1 Tax=Cohaesibacter sp. ES.047 TaxID=1798205 RepID=UPI000BB8BC7E|nr:peptidoglycan-binding protein [Cohaesibacter sp. ES.047]SNY92783.1 Putative peptidoglycan binding domain-containing protein [Cohaesibacter sp. ES.047]